MKKLFALLLTVAMLASMMVPAMAEYRAIIPNNTTIKHSLELTEDTATSLLYNITYNFTVGTPEVVGAADNGVTTAGKAVTGSPSIAPVTYGPDDSFSSTNKTCEKTLTVDWSGVTINEPGIYRWTVTQQDPTSTAPQAPKAPSNANATFYLFMYVTDNAGQLDTTFICSKTATIDPEKKNTTLEETYPAKTVDLTLAKQVDGNQASKDQYFPFDIVLVAPGTTATNFKYTITATAEGSYDANVPETAYHSEATNPSEITVTGGTTGTFRLWLKHGQSVTINDMVYGSSYTITEGGNAGYTVNAVVTGDDSDGVYDNYVTNDISMTGNVTVTYTNVKRTEVPTGIDLQSGVAFAGIILAMGMMVLLFVGKRKEQTF